jgi:hypothetical protein
MCKGNFAADVKEKTPPWRSVVQFKTAIYMLYMQAAIIRFHLTWHHLSGINIYTYCGDPYP